MPQAKSLPLVIVTEGSDARPLQWLRECARVEEIRQHLKRYRDFAAQGKWADAGRELEAIQNEVQK